MPRSESRSTLREGLLGACVLASLSFAWMFSDMTVPNERTRLYLTVAIVDHGTLQVDAPLSRLGRVFDLAQHDGHFYTDKAPGSSFLGVPVYAAARLFRDADSFDVFEVNALLRTWLMLPLGLLGFYLLRSCLRALGVRESILDVASLGMSLGTAMFHYSTALYGHVIVAVCMLGVVRCMLAAGLFRDAPEPPHARRLAWLAGAGACAGLAGLTEYQAVLAAALWALPVLLAPASLRLLGLLAYALGGLPFAGALLLYNHFAFGGPFEISYHHLVGSALTELHGSGLAGATLPSLRALGGLFFSQHRGLLVTSPWLLVGLLGLGMGARWREMPRRLWWGLMVNVACFLLLVSASSVWHGSWAFGPRLLIPLMGLFALAAGVALEHFEESRSLHVFVRAAVVFSLAQHALVQWTFPELPPHLSRPLADSVVPLLSAGLVAPNLMCRGDGASIANLVPAACLALALSGYLSARGMRAFSRAHQATAWVLPLALAAVCALALQPSSLPPRAQRDWVQVVRRAAAAESQCAK